MKKKKLFIIFFCLILLVAGVLLKLYRPHNQGLYKVTILPSLGGNFTLPLAINDKGQIAGFSEVRQGNYHLFLWDKENGMRDLGAVIGDYISLNNAGQISANLVDSNDIHHAFIWDPNAGRMNLPTLGGNNTYAHRINNVGQVVGASETTNGVKHAFVWDALNGMLDLTPNSTTNTRAWLINDSGQIVVLVQSGELLVKVIKNNITPPVPVPLIGSRNINNSGCVAGTIQIRQGTYDIALWHQNFGQKSLFQTNADFSYRINDFNQVIISEHQEYAKIFKKFISPPPNTIYLIDPNLGRIYLDGYINLNSNEEIYITDINNNGWITGAIQ